MTRSLLLFALAALVTATVYENSVTLDPNAQFLFYWTADTTNEILKVKLSVHSDEGWIGFGRSENGGMIGSDVFIAWMGTGGPVLHDRLAVQKAEPPLDVDNGGTEDWTLVSLTQNSGYTVVEATRPFVTGDDQDHPFISGPQQLVFAWNPVAPANGQPVPYHSGGRYPVTLALWGETAGGNNGIDNSTFPPDTATGDMLMPGFTVPTEQTSYYCTGFDLAAAAVQGPGQVIAFEPIVENPLVVHHIVIWICKNPQPSTPHECEAMSPDCSDIMYAWAVGGPGFTVPEEAGFPFGPDSAQYASLQIHYDNSKNQAGIVDHSGMRVYYTQTPRQYNAGFVLFGTDTGSIFLPPGESRYEINGNCPPVVTSVLGGLQLTVFASFLHMHKRGRQIWTDQYRNGDLIGSMGENKFFDFNFQQILLFPQHKLIKAGDGFVTHCVYDTSNETTAVSGGEATGSEMCFNFVAYYPKLPDATACLSDAVHIPNEDDGSSSQMTPLTMLVAALITALFAVQP